MTSLTGLLPETCHIAAAMATQQMALSPRLWPAQEITQQPHAFVFALSSSLPVLVAAAALGSAAAEPFAAVVPVASSFISDAAGSEATAFAPGCIQRLISSLAQNVSSEILTTLGIEQLYMHSPAVPLAFDCEANALTGGLVFSLLPSPDASTCGQWERISHLVSDLGKNNYRRCRRSMQYNDQCSSSSRWRLIQKAYWAICRCRVFGSC